MTGFFRSGDCEFGENAGIMPVWSEKFLRPPKNFFGVPMGGRWG